MTRRDFTMKAMISGAYSPHNSYAVMEVSPDGEISVNEFGGC